MHRFFTDNAGTLMYMELEHELAKYGFTDGPRLEALFRSVDFDKSGTLDFKEFLSLVYLWHNVEDGDYSRLFEPEVYFPSCFSPLRFVSVSKPHSNSHLPHTGRRARVDGLRLH